MINQFANLFKAEDGIYVIFGLMVLAAFLIWILLKLLRPCFKDNKKATEVRWLKQRRKGNKL